MADRIAEGLPRSITGGKRPALNPDRADQIHQELARISTPDYIPPEIPIIKAFKAIDQKDQAIKQELEQVKQELKKANQVIEKLAEEKKINKLTGLPNKEALAEFVDIFDARSDGVITTFIDLTGFGEINRKLGHKKADQKIRNFATAFQSKIRETDFLFHLHGDEFVLISIKRDNHNMEVTPEEGLKNHLKTINDDSEIKFDFESVTFDKSKHQSLFDAINEADTILMARKDAARNQQSTT